MLSSILNPLKYAPPESFELEYISVVPYLYLSNAGDIFSPAGQASFIIISVGIPIISKHLNNESLRQIPFSFTLLTFKHDIVWENAIATHKDSK